MGIDCIRVIATALLTLWTCTIVAGSLRGRDQQDYDRYLFKKEEDTFWGRYLETFSMTSDSDDSDDSAPSFPVPFDLQPTFFSSDGKLEVSLHIGPKGQDFGTPNFRSLYAPGGGYVRQCIFQSMTILPIRHENHSYHDVC